MQSEGRREPWPGQLLPEEKLPVISSVAVRKPLPGESYDWLVVRHRETGGVLAATFVGQMTSERRNPYDTDQMVYDARDEVAARGLGDDYEAFIVRLPADVHQRLTDSPVKVDLPKLTGGKNSVSYLIDDREEEDW